MSHRIFMLKKPTNVNDYFISTGAVVFTLSFLSLFAGSCKPPPEKEKLFHAGPSMSGLGVIYFSLHKENTYKFCDGDFMDDGCYTGDYSLSGDTITMYQLKEHRSIPSNRFLIRRYKDMDSSYWQWKYPEYKDEWKGMKRDDSLQGAEGDILTLNKRNEVVFDKNNYFLIRLDKLKR